MIQQCEVCYIELDEDNVATVDEIEWNVCLDCALLSALE